jgi:hypothetical protein
MSAAPNVYACIAAVSAEIAQTGISKSRNNQQQGYKFRGIDDVYNALAPILAKNKLVILPRMLSREQTERTTAKGGVLFSVVVDAEFDFVSAEDGSKHTTKAYGEAMDSADKATNKAMSAAYKYTAFQTFCIPTEGDNDADAQTHEPVSGPRGVPMPPDVPSPYKDVPAGYNKWWDEMHNAADSGMVALEAAWKESPVAMKAYTSQCNATEWGNLKARAAKVAA